MMKVLIVSVLFFTLVAIFLGYRKNRNFKKLFIALATVGAIVTLGVWGNLTRQVIALFIVHNVLLLFSWAGLMLYLIRDRYYWWVIFSPVLTLGFFLALELLTGSRHEGI